MANRPVAGQLKQSILKYMNSAEFDPEVEVDQGQIQSLFEF
jgi:hypothetical protein